MTGSEAVGRVIALHGNQRFGVTGPDWGECTSVPHSLQREVLGLPIVYGNAKDIFANAPATDYVKLAGNVHILPGDIVIQGGDPVLGTDARYGHVFAATQVSNPGQPITGYSQNYPTGREPHIRTFPRNGLIGVIRAKVLDSGGGASTVDQNYEETFATLCYRFGPNRQPSQGERQARIGKPAGQVYGEIVGSKESRGKLEQMLIMDYNFLLGRIFRGKAINIPLEITPRVNSILAGATIADHRLNIASSAECIAWQKTIKAALAGGGGADPELAQKLQAAKTYADQAAEPIDKIRKL